METFNKHVILLMIEVEVTPQINTTGNLKDDDLVLLNDEIKSKNDK